MSEESIGYKVVEAGKVFVCNSCGEVILEEEGAKSHAGGHVREDASEDAYVRETRFLLGLSLEERDKYSEGVIRAVIGALRRIAETKGAINQKKLFEKFRSEMSESGPEVLTCVMYSVKPRFRGVYVDLMKLVAGIKEEVKVP